jgi:hypothetical protein
VAKHRPGHGRAIIMATADVATAGPVAMDVDEGRGQDLVVG